MKFTKIVCTIGPASEKPAMMKKLMQAGMNVARLNFSHGSYKSHASLIKNVRATAKSLGQPIAILQDLQGPRIRIGEVSANGVKLEKGESVVLVPQEMYDEKSKQKMLPNHLPQLADDVKTGSHILIADGVIDLRVVRVSGPEIHCSVAVGGTVTSHKGMNFPGTTITIPPITKKDKEDAAFGVAHGVDYIALSFVRSAKDILGLRALLRRLSKDHPHASCVGIIAKIERPEAVEDFDKILAVVDGIMVARGDLGIEVPAQKVPVIQKNLIKACIAAKKPVIVATQMMESMISNPRPTRAEVSDVANAVIDHTDAVMLSGESATGLYPLEVVKLMARTVHETEKSRYDDFVCKNISKEKTMKEMVAHAAADVALTKKIKLLVVEDGSAELIQCISSHRPEVRIIGFSHNALIRQQMNLVRGVTMFPAQKNIMAFLKKTKLAQSGNWIAMVKENEVEIEVVK
jgi:pyruvate kinase